MGTDRQGLTMALVDALGWFFVMLVIALLWVEHD
jgi:hypothetical protein